MRFGDRGLEFYRLHVRRHSFSRKSDVVRDALRSRLHLEEGAFVIRWSAELQENQGFSLVELMVVMGVMGVGSIAMSQMIVNQAKVQAKTTGKTDFGQAVSYLDSVMSSDTSCAQALGLPFTYSPTTDSSLQIPAPIPASQVIDINGVGGSKYMSATPMVQSSNASIPIALPVGTHLITLPKVGLLQQGLTYI